MSRLFRLLALLLVAFVLLAVLALIGLFIVSGGQPVDFVQTAIVRLSIAGREADLNRAVSTDDTPVRFTVNPGDVPRVIASNLADQNLILDPDLFVSYVRATDIDSQLRAGTYFLNRAQTIPEIAQTLIDPRGGQFAFRILEGWRIEEIAERVIDGNPYFPFSGAEFLTVVGSGADVPAEFADYVDLPEGASLEGFLFPDTYQLPAQITPELLRDLLLERFTEQVGPALAEAAAEQGLTLYEAVTLASIIQREAVHPDEHPMISSVYRNRLEINQRLEADPTVQYPIGRAGDWWPQITQADYQAVVSPYNTYRVNGLPPGPIANPGISAIRAAIQPAESPYYYFRARCTQDGYHNFARTFEEHVANACP